MLLYVTCKELQLLIVDFQQQNVKNLFPYIISETKIQNFLWHFSTRKAINTLIIL